MSQEQVSDVSFEFPLTLDQYQEMAVTTSGASKYANLKTLPLSTAGLIVGAMGLAGEAGEVVDLLKKSIGHGHELDPVRIALELGDVLWYVAEIANHLDVKLSDVAEANLAKLRSRYPGGFSPQASINREAK